MATVIGKLADRVGKLSGMGLMKVATSILEKEERFVADIQRIQYELGFSSAGARTPAYLNPAYVRSKSPPKSAPGNRWNLRLTGAYWQGVVVDVAPTAVHLVNRNSKSEELEEKAEARGMEGKLTGLNKESIKALNEELLIPELRKKIVIGLLRGL